MDNGKKGKVLVIDDEKMNIIMLAQFLKEYEVIVSLNGEGGLELAERQMPDLILLDVLMPGMDGYEVIEKLKNTDKTKKIPVVFISGLDSEKDKEKGFSLGAADYILKPFTKDAVINCVEKQLSAI